MALSEPRRGAALPASGVTLPSVEQAVSSRARPAAGTASFIIGRSPSGVTQGKEVAAEQVEGQSRVMCRTFPLKIGSDPRPVVTVAASKTAAWSSAWPVRSGIARGS
jgi:hypothetical protein